MIRTIISVVKTYHISNPKVHNHYSYHATFDLLTRSWLCSFIFFLLVFAVTLVIQSFRDGRQHDADRLMYSDWNSLQQMDNNTINWLHITTRMAEKRRGGKPTDVLSVSLFLLEHSHDQRINKRMCSKSAIERLRENGYGPPPESKAFLFWNSVF